MVGFILVLLCMFEIFRNKMLKVLGEGEGGGFSWGGVGEGEKRHTTVIE